MIIQALILMIVGLSIVIAFLSIIVLFVNGIHLTIKFIEKLKFYPISKTKPFDPDLITAIKTAVKQYEKEIQE